MLSVRALRCACNAPHVTRSSAPAISALLAPIRLSSSSATATVEEQDENGEADEIVSRERDLNKPKNPSSQLAMMFGEEHAKKNHSISWDLRKLDLELMRIYSRQRAITETVKGPYRVRTVARDQEKSVKIDVRDNKVFVQKSTIPNIWLRDNCQCGSCMHEATKQRLLDTFSIPKDIAIKTHSFDGSVLKIEWSDGHQSEFSREFFSRTTNPERQNAILRQGLTTVKLWDSTIASDPPKEYYRLTGRAKIARVLLKIRQYGFCYVDDTPITPKATKGLLERIAFIRNTHYGGFYDFTADLASKDTAYTNIALEAHTDNTYFSDPAGLQAFHLLSHTDGEGGASLLVDGFKVADELCKTDREAYEILSTVNVYAHASGNEGISIQPYRAFPVLEHDSLTGDLLRVRWNSSDRASIELPIDKVETWYDAARKFDALLKKKENEYWEQLIPGRVLIFDNWRVLHGRSKFTGKRRICGGYINRDDWISKYKMLQLGREKVLGSLASG
ncbi:Trimethyllysine dioxygenase [Cucurbitaria berberidis CBS 394.84]|uniref:Trimethyllysine dioxygenase n=1 Tax=Cucurbitaria berberidis CBS 394.84 TaxID=1168544 RepID=A0A9P4L568_9PLEO|nr:Trimethyllysine dioxygenase [Cucurbitaria berberidis CBS 394.84]KAF1842032.1 Trimethyllysine dioxygenase [Cucurbitaria berberidis CBS 394.84]